jgi:hypothetical protein
MVMSAPWMIRRRSAPVGAALVGVALLGVLAMAGCAEPTTTSAAAPAPAAASLPPRPRELPLNGIDACSVITSPLRSQLGVSSRMDRNRPADNLNSSDCEWTNFPAEPQLALSVRLVLNQGIEPYLSQPGAQVITVSGFGAVQLPALPANPEQGCTVRLDVASGQSAWVSYTSDSPIPGRTYDEMCARARAAAASVLAQLLARVR